MALAARPGIGWEAISPGAAITRAGRTRRNSSTPAGMRWKGVISAPERVVAIVATSSPSAPAIALAESITRPPPSATSGRSLTRSRIAAAASGTAPGGTCATRYAPSTTAGATSAARSVVSSA